LRVFTTVVLTLGVAGSAAAQDVSHRMDEIFTSPNQATNSDRAFWGSHAFVGYYTGSTGFPPGTGPRGGVRIFDISNPAAPRLVRDFACDGAQNDPILWDRNHNGIADLMLLAVDTTMASPACGAARVPSGTPTGWEGVRVFTMSDDKRNPFANIQQVDNVYTDCGAHTITAWPMKRKLLVYVSSYPLAPGPTCGDTEHRNTANPYDEDPGSPANPLHGVIQIVEVPLSNPAASREHDVQPEISYPGDPDGRIDWCERGGTFCPPLVEPAAVACHDIVVHVEHRVAGAACAEQGQVWEIDKDGIPDTENPMSIGDDEVTSGGRGQFPGAVDFFHSVMFDNDAETVNWVDESFGAGCPTMTNYQPRPWNPAGGRHKTGKMFFSDMEGNFQSEFHVGDLRPKPRRHRVLLGAHGDGRHGHQAGPARQRVVHGRRRRDRLLQPAAPEGDRLLRPGACLRHLVGVPLRRSAVPTWARAGPDLRDGWRRGPRHSPGHGRLPDEQDPAAGSQGSG
jgi:hypothetical protein